MARSWARALTPVSAAVAGVLVATLVVTLLEHGFGVPNAAALYVVAVSAVAIVVGTAGAVLTALGSVLVYDYLFTDPLHTLSVADPGELLNLLLLLFVAVTVGQLAALQRARAELAELREREARALVEIASLLAARDTTLAALPAVAAVLAREPGVARVWISLGGDDASERAAADTGGPESPRRSAAHAVLHRGPDGRPATWTQIRETGARDGAAQPGAVRDRRFRVRIDATGRALGSIWVARPERAGPPGAGTTRLLVVTADQLAQAIEHDRLEAEARRAEIALRSDELKSALLGSVSHDLRTPLASIRTYAGTLMDEEVRLSAEETRASAAAIDREALRLNRIVANLLDLSRIDGGALHARRDALDLEDVVDRAVAEVSPRLAGHRVQIAIAPDLAVTGDPVLLDEVLVNLLDNVASHTPEGSNVRITGEPLGEERVRLTVEDSGPGLPAEDLGRIFSAFYQVRGDGPTTTRPGRAGAVARRRQGTGLGLAVVRGLTEAQHGTVVARSSALGGLAIEMDLPAARQPDAAGAAVSAATSGDRSP